MTLIPSTPPGSPALARVPPDIVSRLRHRVLTPLVHTAVWVRRAYLEPLDRPGVVAVASYALSAISAALGIAVNYTHVLSDPILRQVIPVWYRYGGQWLWALPIIFGIYSRGKLPRLAAWIGVGTMVLYSVRGLTGTPFIPSLLLRTLYITGALLLTLPPLLRRLLGRSDAT